MNGRESCRGGRLLAALIGASVWIAPAVAFGAGSDDAAVEEESAGPEHRQEQAERAGGGEDEGEGPRDGEAAEGAAEAAGGEGTESAPGQATGAAEAGDAAAEDDNDAPAQKAEEPAGDGEAESGADAEAAETDAEAGEGDDDGPGRVVYGDIDEATVRVFSVGNVEVDRIRTNAGSFRVAVPSAGHGTGFATGPEGLIVTAHHVVDAARHIVVRLPGDGGFYPARVLYSDEDIDIAVIEIDAPVPGLEVAGAPELSVRDEVYALGYPLDPSQPNPHSSRGIVAGEAGDDFLQLDIALNPGQSGGPLVDDSDRVAAMVIARGGVELGVQGIGIAVPGDEILAALGEARRRLLARQVAELGSEARIGAVVVDELIQEGALRELSDVEGLEENLESARLDRALERITTRTEDSDLLAFVAGILWNASVAIDAFGARKLGDTTLSRRDARALARRLRSSAAETAERAYESDPRVASRSPFVDVARRSGGELAQVGARGRDDDPNRVDVALRAIVPEVRVRPGAAQVGRGLGFAAGVHLRRLNTELGRFRVAPIVGGALGVATVETTAAEETISHSYFVLELGAAAELGEQEHNLQLQAAYAPGYYHAFVEAPGDGLGNRLETVHSEGEAALIHVRLGAEYRYRMASLGTGVRVLSGPSFWFEPVTASLVFSL